MNIGNIITSFDEYSKRAAETQMESCKGLDYLELGLVGEVCGELCGEIIAKSIRGDFKLEDRAEDIRDESGDACWFADTICVAHYTTLSSILGYDDIRKFEHSMLEISKQGYDKLSDYQLGKELAFHAVSIVTFGRDRARLKMNMELFFVHLITLLHRYGMTLLGAINRNVKKLAKRKELGLITGSGDHRGEAEGGAE